MSKTETNKPHQQMDYWPSFQNPIMTAAMALLHQYEVFETWPAEKLAAHQLRQAHRLLTFAQRTVPYYEDRLKDIARIRANEFTMDQFRQLPILKREGLQQADQTILSTAAPKNHGTRTESYTSGSTASPIKTYSNNHLRIFTRANSLRSHRWHGRDPRGTIADLRPARHGTTGMARRWSWLPDGGLGHTINLNQSLQNILGEIIDLDPDYLHTRPRALLELVRLSEKEGRRPANLKDALIFGETLDQDHRDEITETWGIDLFENYSAVEVSNIATQCGTQGKLHVMSESVICEIVDDDGNEVAPGKTGTVLITALHNYSAPLIRYEIGDFAMRGTACDCGRTLPTIEKVIGRTKNILVLPNGERHFPTSLNLISKEAPILQWRLHQKTPTDLELSLKVPRALSAAEEEAVRNALRKLFGYPFNIELIYVDELFRNPGDKYREFTSDVV
jgi:phenylacetate-CoA ligase